MAVLTVPEVQAPEEIPAPLPTEKISPMKLSEAMRLGILVTAAGKGDLWSRGAACAVGAAWIGAGKSKVYGERQSRVYDWVDKEMNLDFNYIRVPCNHSAEFTLGGVIVHLNDSHSNWPRNRIADWLESIGL